jgi:hypothetical protein
MGAVLRNIIATGNLAPGVPTTVAHGLIDAEGRAILPDHLESNDSDVVVVSADATNVTVRNDGLIAQSANILVARWHSIDRAFPGGAATLAGLPYIPVAGGGSGGQATNVNPPSLDGATLRIYANATGSDATGDGSAGNPYRTWARAMQDVPVFVKDGRVLVDITNLGTEVLAAPITGSLFNASVGPYFTNGFAYFDTAPPVQGWAFLDRIAIVAQPTITQTGLGTFSQVADPTTGRRTITFDVDPGFGVNALVGSIVLDNGRPLAEAASRVVSNTSDSIVVTESFDAFVGPIEIGVESATLQLGAGGGAGIELNALAGVEFAGVYFSGSGVLLSAVPGAGPIAFNQCRIGGSIGVTMSVTYTRMVACYIDATGFFTLSCAGAHSRNLYAGTRFNMRGSGVGDFLIMQSNTYDQCQSLGHSIDSTWDSPSMPFEINKSHINNPAGNGIGVRFAAGHNLLFNTVIENCSGDCVDIRGGAFARVRNVDGSSGNTAHGIRVSQGAQAQVDATTSVTGASGDVIVGGNAAASTYAAVAGGVTDLGAASPQLCRAAP